ncbi:hypothetical protein D3C72_2120730 [compost metagenome]
MDRAPSARPGSVERQRQANTVRREAQLLVEAVRGFTALAARQRQLVTAPGAGAFDGFVDQGPADTQAAGVGIHDHVLDYA